MPAIKFEINNKDLEKELNEVLVEIPYGKFYLSNTNSPQKSQKGETCWYYVLNYLRPRYGRLFKEDIPERRNEKIISEARKQLEEQDNFKKICSFIEKYFPSVSLTKENLNKMLSIFSSITDTDFSKEIKIITEFLKQDTFELFEKFAQNQFLQSKISIYQQALAKLNLDVDKIFKKHVKKYYSAFENKSIPIEQLEKIYADLFLTNIGKIYKLKKPDGIQTNLLTI